MNPNPWNYKWLNKFPYSAVGAKRNKITGK